MNKINKEELFQQIRNATQIILDNIEQKESSGLSNQDYVVLFNKIADFASQGPTKNGENLHEKQLHECFTQQIAVFFEGIQKKLENKNGILYLEEFVNCSSNYSFYSGWLVRFFKFLDQYHMKKKNTDLARESFYTFKSMFLKNIQYDVFNEVFGLLDNERDGFDTKKSLIYKVIQFYFLMCYDKDIKLDYEKDSKQFLYSGVNEKQDYEFYKVQFEVNLLKNIHQFYSNKINNKWLTESSAEFVSRSLEAFKKEDFMADSFYPMSKDKIRELLKKLLIEDFYNVVLDNPKSGLKQMMLNNSDFDLENCYKLYIQVEYIMKEKISALVKDYVEFKANQICKTPLQNLKNIQEISNCFEGFIQLKKDIEHKLEKFNNYLEIEKSVDNAFYSFYINDESARYLAIYFDLMLRKLQKTKSDSDTDMPYLIKIFKYLSSRDEFFEVYKKKLISRILDETIKSFDFEKDCLSKLKKECGVLSTIMNCESILQDTEGISKTNTSNFKENLKMNGYEPKFDFDIKILEKSSYSAAKKQQNFEMINELSIVIKMFQNFYKEKHQNRLIEFIFQDGLSEIYFNTNKKYRLVIFNDSLPIFMLFNSSKSIDKNNLLMKTGLLEKTMDDRLIVCEKLQILLKKNDVYTVNENFKSEKPMHELPKINPKREGNAAPSTGGVSGGNGATAGTGDPEVDELKVKRQSILDATLVRIMKFRITMSYNDLMGDCTKLVINIFKPDVKMIRSRIESLMERGYMGRDEADPKILKYIS